MKVAISQPRYLPALNYLQRLCLVDVFVLLDTVQYTPRDWENRNRIRTRQGRQWLSVPVAGHYRGRLLKDTRLDQTLPWPRQHLQTLMHSYQQAPYFNHYRDFLEEVYRGRSWENLCDLNRFIIEGFLSFLGQRPQLVWASEMGSAGRGSDLILDLCRRLPATVYISGPLGRDYLSPEAFAAAGIELWWHDYAPPPYFQIHGEPFMPWLSAIDLFCNEGPNAAGILREGALLTIPADLGREDAPRQAIL